MSPPPEQPTVKMQVRNDPADGGPVTVSWGGEVRFTIEPGEMKAIFVRPGTTEIVLDGAFGTLRHCFSSAGEERILLSLAQSSGSLLSRLRGAPSVAVHEVSRAFQAAHVPPPPRLQVLQIWAGQAESPERFYRFVGEREDYYEKLELDDAYALSDFIESQGQDWFDHDFTEALHADGDGPVATRFGGSWVDKWGDWVDARARGPINVIWFMAVDRPGTPEERRPVLAPRDVAVAGLTLHYLGECSFEA